MHGQQTPWTLPSNTALTVGPEIDYVIIHTYNQYTLKLIRVVIAKDLITKQLGGKYILVNNATELEIYDRKSKKSHITSQKLSTEKFLKGYDMRRFGKNLRCLWTILKTLIV